MANSIDLDALVGNAGEVRIGKKAHAVRPLDGAGFKTLFRISRKEFTNEETLEQLYDIAKRVCPTLADQIDTLDARQVGAIVRLSGSHISAMDKHPKSSRRQGRPKPTRGRE